MTTVGGDFLDPMHGSMTRPALQPLPQLLDGSIVTAGPDFDTAVGQIDCMPVEVQLHGGLIRAGPEENTLNAPGDFEQAAHAGKCGAAIFRLAGRNVLPGMLGGRECC